MSAAARRVFVALGEAGGAGFAVTQARRQVEALRRRGVRAVLTAPVIEPRLRGEAIPLEWALRQADEGPVAWIAHYDRWSPETTALLRGAQGAKVLWFHGFAAPERLVQGEGEWRRSLEARRALPALAQGWDLVVADSGRDRRVLERAGARRVTVAAPLLDDPGPAANGGRPAPTVLCPGPVAPGRGLDSAVKAVALLRRLHRPDARLVVAGPWRGQERFVAGLTTLAGEVGLGPAVGVSEAPEDDPPPAGVALDLATEGGYPAGLAAAMLRGCPALMAAGGPAADILGEGGLVLPADDPPFVAEALAATLGDPALRSDLIATGRRACAHLVGEPAADRVAEALAPVLAQP